MQLIHLSIQELIQPSQHALLHTSIPLRSFNTVIGFQLNAFGQQIQILSLSAESQWKLQLLVFCAHFFFILHQIKLA